MKHAILAAMALTSLLIAAPSGAQQARNAPTVDIVNDKGGNVMRAIARRAELQRSGRQVRIMGYCRSACTIYLTLPNACLGGFASVGFHAPRLPGTNIIPPGVGELMGNFYRGKIRENWMREWQYSRAMRRLSAQEYRRLDPQIRMCPPSGRNR